MRDPRPCVCGHAKDDHAGVCLGCVEERGRLLCMDYDGRERTEPLRAPRRPTFTTTWSKEPGPPPLKVIVRNEADQVVAVCYGTTEGVTLPSDLASGERYTLQPIIGSLHVALPIRPHDDASA
jgi:hypothetical protein